MVSFVLAELSRLGYDSVLVLLQLLVQKVALLLLEDLRLQLLKLFLFLFLLVLLDILPDELVNVSPCRWLELLSLLTHGAVFVLLLSGQAFILAEEQLSNRSSHRSCYGALALTGEVVEVFTISGLGF